MALGLIAIATGLMAFPQVLIQKTLGSSEQKIDRKIQIDSMKQKMSSIEDALTTSSLVTPANDTLCPCTQGGAFMVGATKVCALNVCQGGQEMEFDFYKPNTTPLTKLAGKSTSPVYYMVDGKDCIPIPDVPESENGCAYKALSKFKPHCVGDLPTCDHANYISVTLEFLPIGTKFVIGAEKTQFLYFVPLNYNPKITAILDQTLTLGSTSKLPVIADAGEASERQGFIFEKCESSDSTRVEVKCYRFIDSVGQIILTAKGAGTAQITLQINDGGSTNSLSNPMVFNVTVP